jgi:hypothetical protein
MADDPKKTDAPAGEGDSGENIRMLAGTAIGGLTGYLLTRYGLGSKDVPLRLVGTGLGAAIGGTLAGELGTQMKAERDTDEAALEHAKANAAFGQKGGRLAWLNPLTAPGESAGEHRLRVGLNAALPAAAGVATWKSTAANQFIPNSWYALRNPRTTILAPPPPPPVKGAPPIIRNPAHYGRWKVMSTALAAAATLLPSDIIRSIVAARGEQRRIQLTPEE